MPRAEAPDATLQDRGPSGLPARKRLILGITASILLLLTSFTLGNQAASTAPRISTDVAGAAMEGVVEKKALVAPMSPPTHTENSITPTTEEYVRGQFWDNPILSEVARCESQFRQFTKDGSVLRGSANSDDVGVMQINEYFHDIKAKKLGFDLETLEGNVGYAKWLFEKEGTEPWNASRKCWNAPRELAKK